MPILRSVSDRLPVKVQPGVVYLNMIAGQPPHDPFKVPRGTKCVILYDGANDEQAAGLVATCVTLGLKCEVLALNLAGVAHIPLDAEDDPIPPMCGLERMEAYTPRGRHWIPTPQLLDTIREMIVQDDDADVIADALPA